MKWDNEGECVIYVLNNQLTAMVDDLQPYQEHHQLWKYLHRK
jgi:hypothetical protein